MNPRNLVIGAVLLGAVTPLWASAFIQSLEQALSELGYPVGTVDGEFDPQLSEAVRQFQTDAGLEVNGLLNKETRRALLRAHEAGEPMRAAPPPSPPPGVDADAAAVDRPLDAPPRPAPAAQPGPVFRPLQTEAAAGAPLRYNGLRLWLGFAQGDEVVVQSGGGLSDLRAGGGLELRVAYLRPLGGGPFAIGASAGIKGDQSSGGEATLTAVPAALLGYWRHGDAMEFGLGVGADLSPELGGDLGDLRFDDAIGPRVEFNFAVAERLMLQASWTALEYSINDVTLDAGGPAIDLGWRF